MPVHVWKKTRAAKPFGWNLRGLCRRRAALRDVAECDPNCARGWENCYGRLDGMQGSFRTIADRSCDSARSGR